MERWKVKFFKEYKHYFKKSKHTILFINVNKYKRNKKGSGVDICFTFFFIYFFNNKYLQYKRFLIRKGKNFYSENLVITNKCITFAPAKRGSVAQLD